MITGLFYDVYYTSSKGKRFKFKTFDRKIDAINFINDYLVVHSGKYYLDIVECERSLKCLKGKFNFSALSERFIDPILDDMEE